jgi:hypothetical protein
VFAYRVGGIWENGLSIKDIHINSITSNGTAGMPSVCYDGAGT